MRRHARYDATIVAGIAAGRSFAETAHSCGVSTCYVYTRRLRLGLPIAEPSARHGDRHDAAIMAGLAKGQTRAAIARELGVSGEFMRRRSVLLVGPRWRRVRRDSLSPAQLADYLLFKRKGYRAAEALELVLREAA